MLIALIIVLFLSPYEKAVHHVDFDCDAPFAIDWLFFPGSQS